MARGSSGLLSLSGVEEGHDAVVGDSPVRGRKGGTMHTPAPLGSSQGYATGSAELDSLLDDSRVRDPPDIVWDSEEEID